MSHVPESASSSHDSKYLEAARKACCMIPKHVSKKDFLEMLGDEIGTIVPCITAEDVKAMKRNLRLSKGISFEAAQHQACAANRSANAH